ncbi:hypothetical protein RDV89_18385 [Nocardioides zeae]|uniref:Glycosyltransferase n=1 Tax=Nocardioides imazamoxiresistens TaxID=3231893 RepID=A0ABU3Q200_9ACTN|nr:hypothetical protein [Nocardioides zeae]MDT9595062.1 hypothetical protein [Nocardioides zeae]
MAELPVTLALGAPEHGVTRYALEVADWVGGLVALDPADLAPRSRVHLHVTDRVLADSPEAAAEVVRALGDRHRLSVTLHDVPQPTDGTAFERRAACYRAAVAAAEGWAVSSQHERAGVERWCDPGTPGTVVPLPVIPFEQVGDPAPGGAPSVGVFGFVYPGKGHAEAVDALAALAAPAALHVLGAAAPGHEADLDALVRDGRARSVPVHVSGRVPEAEVPAALRRVTVPVVGHRNVSASGSLNSWLAAGRRPLVRDGAYAREMAALRPGTLALYTDDELVDALAEALADPASTWLAPGTSVRPGPADVASAYRAWWDGLEERGA